MRWSTSGGRIEWNAEDEGGGIDWRLVEYFREHRHHLTTCRARAQSIALEYCDAGAADLAYKQINNFASMAVHDGIHEFEQI